MVKSKVIKPVEEQKEKTKTEEKSEVTPCISLRGGSLKTVGRNKSGMPWKKKSSMSSFKTKKVVPKSFEKRMEDSKKIKALQ